MVKLVYVHVGETKSKYYKMLQISLASVRYHMPNIEVNLVVDDITEEDLIINKAQVLNDENLKLISVKIPNTYSPVEKSRYIKTSLRSYISGDFIFLDTDTVMCCDFSNYKVTDSVSMVRDCHRIFGDDLWSENLIKNAKIRGLDISNVDKYYNSGVMVVKDDEKASELYRNWHECWEQTRKPGFHQDQYALAAVNEKVNAIVEIDKKWNFQIGVSNALITDIHNANIIHYFATKSNNSIYKLNNSDTLNQPIDSEIIKNIIENPKTSFNPFCAYLEGSTRHNVIKSPVFKLLTGLYKKRIVFNALCSISSFILAVRTSFVRAKKG